MGERPSVAPLPKFGWLKHLSASCLVLLLSLLSVSRILAQTPATGSISGRVVAAENGVPLDGVTATLERIGGAATEIRWAVTGASGSYQFRRLPAAEFRLSFERPGYLPTIFEVDLRNVSSTRVSVGMELDPVMLSPLRVLGGDPEPYARMQEPRDAGTGARILSDRLRAARYLVSDTKQLTHEEVIEAVTLAEPDIFRALQRVPGVSTRDDYTATMWTRGASWDQTRVYFDGLPLYNPTHAGWLFSAVNPDAIGAVAFHPGYRSAQWGEGAAAILDLKSRTGRAGGSLNTSAEVSLASARVALDGEIPRTDATWMLALRRSYVDLISGVASGLGASGDLHIPYDFSDVVARLDGRLLGQWGFEASTILEYDRVRGDLPGLVEGNRGQWGNRAGRLSLSGPLGPLRAQVTVGATDFSTRILGREPSAGDDGSTIPALSNAIRHRSIALEVEPNVYGAEGRLWAAGLRLVSDPVAYSGPFSVLDALIARNPFDYGEGLNHLALWGERRWSLHPRVEAITGLRVEVGDSVYNGGRARMSPRIALRAEPIGQTAVTMGWSRAYQYTQDVAPAAGPVGPELPLSALWVVASPASVFPAVKTDLGTVGIERGFGGGWSALANGYIRFGSGIKIPNPVPGEVTISRNLDGEAQNRAYGFELTARKMVGDWTGSIGYAYGVSEMIFDPPEGEGDDELPPGELRFAAPSDIRHSFDGTGSYRVYGGFTVGGAFTVGSGVPFTRLLIQEGDPEGPRGEVQSPNALRTPGYASVDAVLEYGRAFQGWQLGAYFQVKNLLDRTNAVTYSGSRDCSVSGPSEFCSGESGIVDRFEAGLPRLPMVGVRVAF